MDFNDLKTSLFGHETYEKSVPPTIKTIAKQLEIKLKTNVGYKGGLLLQSKNPYLTLQLIADACTAQTTTEATKIITNIKNLNKYVPSVHVIRRKDFLKLDLVKAQMGSAYETKFIPNLKCIDESNLILIGHYIYNNLKE